MIKITFCLRRKEGMTLDEFQAYWRETHAPLVRERAEALRIRRYVQLHTRLNEVTKAIGTARGAPEPFDGVAELWFDSLEDLQAAGATPDGRAAAKDLFEDEQNFIDFANSPIWVGEEYEVVG